MEARSVSHGEGPIRVEAVAVWCGSDVCVCFGGGEAPHIGAVALGIPRPSLADPDAPSASASVLCVTGHKEDELARDAALKLATALRCRVNVSVGMHLDDPDAADIRGMSENFHATLEKIVGLLGADRVEARDGGKS